MNRMETEQKTERENELIEIPKSHLQAMNAKMMGIKNLIRIYVAKENELRGLKRKYETLEAKHSEAVQEYISEKIRCMSVNDRPHTAGYHSLPLEQPKTKQIGVSEEKYYELLKELCHARAVVNTLRKTSDKPLKIDSWTQMDEMKKPPDTSANNITELTQNNQALQEQLKNQQLELESLREQNSDLSKQLEQVRSEKRSVEEGEKRASAKLKKATESHKRDQREIQKLKEQLLEADVIQKPTVLYRECSPRVFNNFSHPQVETVVADCGEECSPTKDRQCTGCEEEFSSDDDLEYHTHLCEKLKQNPGK